MRCKRKNTFKTWALAPLAIMAASMTLAFAWLAPHEAAAAQKPAQCAGKDLICHVTNVEDLARIEGSNWIVGSSLPGGAGHTAALYLFNTKTGAAKTVHAADIAIAPDKNAYPDCPAPPDFSKFGSHGLDFHGAKGMGRLLVINHAGRESIEAFDVDARGSSPKLRWTGCVVAPETAWPDGVATLAGGGFVATSLWDPHDKDFASKLEQGQAVGGLFEWHRQSGWKDITPPGVSGPNGVLTSKDGNTVFVNLWPERKILKLDRNTGQATTVAIDLLPDNIRWSEDGSFIIVGGQDATVQAALQCFASKDINCAVPFKLFKLDPASMTLTELVKSGVYDGMGSGTGALQVGADLWASSFRADRIVRFRNVLKPLTARSNKG